jgi:phosphoribosyl 1,2-cyclic phosphodiesterase
MLSFTILGSGSSGNCAVVSTPDTTLLVDAGLSAKQILLRLEAAGFQPSQLDGILLTHEHGDHTAGLEVFTKKWQVPIYATALTREMVGEDYAHSVQWRMMRTGNPFEIKSLRIESFPVPHDAVDPVGYTFSDSQAKLGFLSDVGYVTNLIKDRLAGAHTLFVEANYDTEMLEADTKRPWSTKQRISSRHGHLSNEQTAELIGELAHAGLEQVVLGHLSSDCNEPDVACGFIRRALEPHGLSAIDIWCADRHSASPTRPVRRGAGVLALQGLEP